MKAGRSASTAYPEQLKTLPATRMKAGMSDPKPTVPSSSSDAPGAALLAAILAVASPRRGWDARCRDGARLVSPGGRRQVRSGPGPRRSPEQHRLRCHGPEMSSARGRSPRGLRSRPRGWLRPAAARRFLFFARHDGGEIAVMPFDLLADQLLDGVDIFRVATA